MRRLGLLTLLVWVWSALKADGLEFFYKPVFNKVPDLVIVGDSLSYRASPPRGMGNSQGSSDSILCPAFVLPATTPLPPAPSERTSAPALAVLSEGTLLPDRKSRMAFGRPPNHKCRVKQFGNKHPLLLTAT